MESEKKNHKLIAPARLNAILHSLLCNKFIFVLYCPIVFPLDYTANQGYCIFQVKVQYYAPRNMQYFSMVAHTFLWSCECDKHLVQGLVCETYTVGLVGRGGRCDICGSPTIALTVLKWALNVFCNNSLNILEITMAHLNPCAVLTNSNIYQGNGKRDFFQILKMF